ncbi:hypothetical protein KCP74_21865 [Salmonella enterica subsp. enterica]|nr:hypothetical protein KCP74_21865 [Salmonella enterica subsp. enterica]
MGRAPIARSSAALPPAVARFLTDFRGDASDPTGACNSTINFYRQPG